MTTGALLSDYFLSDGVATVPGWQSIDQVALVAFRAIAAPLLADFAQRRAPDEATTERDLIDKILPALGWNDFLPQQKANDTGRSDVPDYLLFLDPAAKQAATRERAGMARYGHGASIVEAKAWDVALDRSEPGHSGAPSTQVLRYLGTIDVASNGAIRFGILTNGSVWRLYDIKARSKLEGFYEVDLSRTVADDDALARFLLFFSRAAFVAGAGGRSPLELALEANRGFEARVTDALAKTVFDDVFPQLAAALAANDPECPPAPDNAYFDELREAALTWLYRLLFVLYAEDRDLLPTRARDDGLRATREAVAAAIDNQSGLSARRKNFDGDLRDLWQQIDSGDPDVGLPPYNGGLFRQGRSPLLDRSIMPDASFAPLLDALSRERTAGRPRLINYRDLSVQHLGSVYERLLEFDLGTKDGAIVAQLQTFARKTSGSYYTPEELVMLVIRRTIGPLLDERCTAFATALEAESRSKQDATYRLARLAQHDPATAFLTLRICDPAMGSGHFLVSLVDYLADQVMVATDDAAQLVSFGDYRSPLLDRLETIRNRIRQQAADNGWAVDEGQLIDRQLVRRIILKRVIHGVDKNPMAVELAKLALWLHTFTVGAPLSFLDHHLHCGDSLFGEWVGDARTRLDRGGLFRSDLVTQAERSIAGMALVEDLTDADIGEVHQSADTYAQVMADIAPLQKMMSLLQGYRWIEGITAEWRKQSRALDREANRIGATDMEESRRLARQAWDMRRKGMALDSLLDGELGDPTTILDQCYGRIGAGRPWRQSDEPALEPLLKAAEIADISAFLHWELAFPNVWRNWSSAAVTGGFDAVIGNPPWDRLKMQEVEWFASRRQEIARATRAADRDRMVRELKASGDPLASEYERASEIAALASRMANLGSDVGGQFPLLGRGDTNLYSLFVERAQRLVNPQGIVGLLVPSGISGDLGASRFFRSVSEAGRLASLLDYANRPVAGGPLFFDDVDSRFKFCALVFGGSARTFEAAECGFFLTATNDNALEEQTFALGPTEFAAVNPNTGTAPVFRTPRDADLTKAIYARCPVLVRHPVRDMAGSANDAAAAGASQQVQRAWPVRYSTMFHMTNDSHLFRTRAELEADGWYPVAGGRLRKGEGHEAVPLYVGRMFRQFDHRAANVTVNEENLHNAANSDATTSLQKTDPNFQPEPQYWVEWDKVEPQREWVLAFRDIARPTDVRTMISAILPGAAYGNTACLLLSDSAQSLTLLASNLNSLVLDYVARQKLQGTHANWYIVEQLPVIPPAAFDRAFGPLTARQIIERDALHLTYTAHDMAPYARAMGFDGDPFPWNDADRRQQRARLDALFFHLYGIGRDDADYILSTFPIVRDHDQRDHGRYLTRDLIMGHMSALAAGDPHAIIDIR